MTYSVSLQTGDIEAATRNSLLSLDGNGGGGGSSSPDVVDLADEGQGRGADGARRPVVASGAGRNEVSLIDYWSCRYVL